MSQLDTLKYVESDPHISPDEKYLIFFSLERPENYGQYDLYISYNVGDNQWSKPVNLGPDLNKGVSRFPRLSPDERF